MTMFANLTSTPSRKNTKPSGKLDRTIEFLQTVIDHGARLSYACLAQSAKELGENSSNQKLAQAGSRLVKSLPEALQPFVCRRSGGYAKGVKWSVETPIDLETRPTILHEQAPAAVAEWLASLPTE